MIDKRLILLGIAAVCVGLYFYGSDNLPYLDNLATIGGLAYALKNLADLAKQPHYEQLPNTQPQPKHSKQY